MTTINRINNFTPTNFCNYKEFHDLKEIFDSRVSTNAVNSITFGATCVVGINSLALYLTAERDPMSGEVIEIGKDLLSNTICTVTSMVGTIYLFYHFHNKNLLKDRVQKVIAERRILLQEAKYKMRNKKIVFDSQEQAAKCRELLEEFKAIGYRIFS